MGKSNKEPSSKESTNGKERRIKKLFQHLSGGEHRQREKHRITKKFEEARKKNP